MLIAYSFPEDIFVDILTEVSKKLEEKEIKYTRQIPHVSLAHISHDLTEDEQNQVKDALKVKPVLTGKNLAIFEGTKTPRTYLVITLEPSKEFLESKKKIEEMFKLESHVSTPHVSILSVDKKDSERLKEVASSLDIENMFLNKKFQTKYIYLWNKNEIPDTGKEDVEDNKFVIVKIMEKVSQIKEDITTDEVNHILDLLTIEPKTKASFPYTIAKEGGVIVNNKMNIDAYKNKKKNTEPIKEKEIGKTNVIVDMRKEKDNPISHLFALKYTPKAWRNHVLFPEMADKIVHIGAFKNKDCAENYLAKKTGLGESINLDEIQAYHGTNKVFKQFDKASATRNAKEYGPANYFTVSPEDASDYAGDEEGSQVHIVNIDTDNFKFWDVSDHKEYLKIAKELELGNIEEKDKGYNWFSELVSAINDEYFEDSIKAGSASAYLAKKLEKMGYAGVIVPKDYNGSRKADWYVVYDDKAIKHKYNDNEIKEDSWAKEVGQIKSELGELDDIYKDFDSIYNRLNRISDIVPEYETSKISSSMEKVRLLVIKAEDKFRQITDQMKAPSRSPIKQSTPIADPKREMERISTDIAKLSVRVRNIGQSVDDFENVKVSDVAETFEKASEQLRKVFVKFEKLIPENSEELSNLNEEEKLKDEELPLASFDYEGIHFETGKPVSFSFLRNTSGVRKYAKKNEYQQDIEPYGMYVVFDDNPNKDLPEGWMRGEMDLKNPLVLKWNGRYQESSWKAVLFNKFKKKGKSLSLYLMNLGYDGIVTFDGKYPTEIVQLNKSSLLKKEETEILDESKKKKKKKLKTMLAPFYGKGDGKSGATIPPFRTNMSNTKLGPSLPGPSGVNAPQFGTLPAGPTAPMVSSKENASNMLESDFSDEVKQTNEALKENFHLCLVCRGTGKTKSGQPCKICQTEWRSTAVTSFQQTMVDGGGKDNTDTFAGFDRGWDL